MVLLSQGFMRGAMDFSGLHSVSAPAFAGKHDARTRGAKARRGTSSGKADVKLIPLGLGLNLKIATKPQAPIRKRKESTEHQADNQSPTAVQQRSLPEEPVSQPLQVVEASGALAESKGEKLESLELPAELRDLQLMESQPASPPGVKAGIQKAKTETLRVGRRTFEISKTTYQIGKNAVRVSVKLADKSSQALLWLGVFYSTGVILPGSPRTMIPLLIHTNSRLMPLLPMMPDMLAEKIFKADDGSKSIRQVLLETTAGKQAKEMLSRAKAAGNRFAETDIGQKLRLAKEKAGITAPSTRELTGWLTDRPGIVRMSNEVAKPFAEWATAVNSFKRENPRPDPYIPPLEGTVIGSKRVQEERIYKHEALMAQRQYDRGLKKAKWKRRLARIGAALVAVLFNYSILQAPRSAWKLWPGFHEPIGTYTSAFELNGKPTGITTLVPDAYIVAPSNRECMLEVVDAMTKTRLWCITSGSIAQELHRLPQVSDHDFEVLDRPIAGGLRNGGVTPAIQPATVMQVHPEGEFWDPRSENPYKFWVERFYNTWFKQLPIARITLRSPEELEGHPELQALIRSMYVYGPDGKPIRLKEEGMATIAALAGLALDATYRSYRMNTNEIENPVTATPKPLPTTP